MPETELPLVHVYSDGACSPNPGWGGWGVLLIAKDRDDYTRELSGAEANSTNNRMELTGAIMGLRALKQPCRVVMHTDSQYVHNAFARGWLRAWQRNGWITSARKAVLNRDLWEELIELEQKHQVQWRWVRGHADDELLNRCDELAVAARKALREQLGSGG